MNGPTAPGASLLPPAPSCSAHGSVFELGCSLGLSFLQNRVRWFSFWFCMLAHCCWNKKKRVNFAGTGWLIWFEKEMGKIVGMLSDAHEAWWAPKELSDAVHAFSWRPLCTRFIWLHTDFSQVLNCPLLAQQHPQAWQCPLACRVGLVFPLGS